MFCLHVKTGSTLKWASLKCDQQGPLVLWKFKSRRDTSIGWRTTVSNFDDDEDHCSHLHLPGISDWWWASSPWAKKNCRLIKEIHILVQRRFKVDLH